MKTLIKHPLRLLTMVLILSRSLLAMETNDEFGGSSMLKTLGIKMNQQVNLSDVKFEELFKDTKAIEIENEFSEQGYKAIFNRILPSSINLDQFVTNQDGKTSTWRSRNFFDETSLHSPKDMDRIHPNFLPFDPRVHLFIFQKNADGYQQFIAEVMNTGRLDVFKETENYNLAKKIFSEKLNQDKRMRTIGYLLGDLKGTGAATVLGLTTKTRTERNHELASLGIGSAPKPTATPQTVLSEEKKEEPTSFTENANYKAPIELSSDLKSQVDSIYTTFENDAVMLSTMLESLKISLQHGDQTKAFDNYISQKK